MAQDESGHPLLKFVVALGVIVVTVSTFTGALGNIIDRVPAVAHNACKLAEWAKLNVCTANDADDTSVSQGQEDEPDTAEATEAVRPLEYCPGQSVTFNSRTFPNERGNWAPGTKVILTVQPGNYVLAQPTVDADGHYRAEVRMPDAPLDRLYTLQNTGVLANGRPAAVGGGLAFRYDASCDDEVEAEE